MDNLIADEKKVLALVKEYKEPHVKTVPIAHALGIEVYDVHDLDDRISGMIKKDKKEGGKSGYAIYNNKNHPDTRKRFTTAHEIAHYVLHRNVIGDGIVEDALYRSNLGNILETEANEFAAKILMPDHLLKNAIARESEPSIVKLAELFRVSKAAMIIRLRNSNIVEMFSLKP